MGQSKAFKLGRDSRTGELKSDYLAERKEDLMEDFDLSEKFHSNIEDCQ